MENNHATVLEIDLNAVASNLNYFKSKLQISTKVLAVVKAFGYGSDALAIANKIAKDVAYFAVAYTPEGIALRNAGIKNPILVLHPQLSNLERLISYNLEPNIYSLKILEMFAGKVNEMGFEAYPIHLKINTGLNRLGFSSEEVSTCISFLKGHKELVVKSIFSHVAASEDPLEKEFTLSQIHKFEKNSEFICQALNIQPMRHMLNTSGVLNYAQEAQFDMVRIGIGLLGFGNDLKETQNLKNVFQLKTVISQIHVVSEGESIGYNRAYTALTQMKTATVPIGHADGISRQLGNGKGYVYINNMKAPIVGNVCMDMLMVDITNIPCNEGDEVMVYRDQEHIECLAQATNTISYELLTAISQRITRVQK